jgi:hypothetical protein
MTFTWRGMDVVVTFPQNKFTLTQKNNHRKLTLFFWRLVLEFCCFLIHVLSYQASR